MKKDDSKQIYWTEPPDDEFAVQTSTAGNGHDEHGADETSELPEMPIESSPGNRSSTDRSQRSRVRNVIRTSEAKPADGEQQRKSEPSPNGGTPSTNGGRVPELKASELRAEGISAWFGSNKVLEDVSLTMEARSVTALIGPSGCGKSTFLRILNRMHELVPIASLAGSVLLDGADIYAPDQRPTDTRRNIGMVFQKPNPFPAMSIYDNVLAGPKLTKTPMGNRDDLVEQCLRSAGLWNEVRTRLKDPGGGLSGGQQQRLCIARALAIRPRVLLMDEPCSALDPTSTRRIEETIDDISHEVTIVIVTHNMQQAQRVSHRCAFFLAGENEPGYIVEEGETEQIFNNPSDPQTNDYVNGRFG